jgi:hypothetical protein
MTIHQVENFGSREKTKPMTPRCRGNLVASMRRQKLCMSICTSSSSSTIRARAHFMLQLPRLSWSLSLARCSHPSLRCGPRARARHEARRAHRHGNWIPNDPTLVAQILKISAAYTPPPPEGFVSPILWGVESHVIERFVKAGIATDKISFGHDTFTFNSPRDPAAFLSDFRNYYGPTMNAFDAAEKAGRATDLQRELESLFSSQNRSQTKGATSIPATFLRVTEVV